MLKTMILLGLMALALIGTASAVQVCFTLSDDDFTHLKGAYVHNYNWKPSMNITQNQFVRNQIIKQWQREVYRYDLWLYRQELIGLPIS